jgi:uncharacterized membrane protein
MTWPLIQKVLSYIQHFVSLIGVLIILSGILFALYQYLIYFFTGDLIRDNAKVNTVRLNLGRVLILGLEFIVAADLIGTTTTPDYYALGILAIIVIVRTILNFSLNRELMTLTKET